MIPRQWTPPCNNQCTHKYAALVQIPWRVFCKKGCDSDGETWEDCLVECDKICYKDPVLKDRQWSAYIDRSPGAASYSEMVDNNLVIICNTKIYEIFEAECFHACVAGCGYKFDLPSEKVNQVHSKRPSNPLTVEKPPAPPAVESRPPCDSASADDIPSISA